MAPEYALEGLFSIKSDVYSFGVVVLEIISGKKKHYQCDQAISLLNYVSTISHQTHASFNLLLLLKRKATNLLFLIFFAFEKKAHQLHLSINYTNTYANKLKNSNIFF